jgi:molybdenum cofactor biosynthesis enzyme MoaA
MSFEEIKKMAEYLFEGGAREICLTGGEPLCRDDFDKIISELKQIGFDIFLDSNGDFFFKHSNVILEDIKVLGLPIDFVNKSYRCEENVENAFKILEFLKSASKRPLIRIGTVITKDNIGELNNLAEKLGKYPVDIWKIYQFLPQNKNALTNRQSLEVPYAAFDLITRKLSQTKFSFKLVTCKVTDRDKAYFFINPNGVVFMPTLVDGISVEKELGSIFDTTVVEKWQKAVSKSNFENNNRLTFR